MMPRRSWGLLIVVALLAAACGGGDGASTSTPGDVSPSTAATGDGAGEDGNAQPASNDGLPPSVPDGFPIAIPPGWQVDLNNEIGLTVSAPRLLYPTDAYDTLVAFYEEWADEQSFECARADPPDSVSFTCFDESPLLIMITRDYEERDATWTLLTASGSSEG